jgi:hypothetical protein
MSAPTIDPGLVEQVRQAIEDAESQGRPRPGRPALAKITGASEHQIRRILADLDAMAATEDTDVANQATIPFQIPGGFEWPATRPLPPAWQATDLSGAHGRQITSTPVNAGEPQQRQPRPWPLILIGLAAAVAVWGGWVELGHLTGFGLVQPLPGLVDSLQINTAIVLPVGIEAYGGYALRTWLSSTGRTRSFARWSAIASLVVGAAAQVASHLMRSNGVTVAPPLVTVLVSCVPVLVLGLATGLATLVRRDASQPPAATREAA